YLTFASSHIGVSTPSPDLLFALTQKVGKKVKTTPASLEKLTLGKLKSSKLIPTKYVETQTRTIFNRLPHLFFGSPAEVAHSRTTSVYDKTYFNL
ncbi:MAG: hypothetical protein PHS59_14455, partial [Paludibacter sp.]|nr:hypothetical protein [Paludibacter sp.]